jgi:hypothetical protein
MPKHPGDPRVIVDRDSGIEGNIGFRDQSTILLEALLIMQSEITRHSFYFFGAIVVQGPASKYSRSGSLGTEIGDC